MDIRKIFPLYRLFTGKKYTFPFMKQTGKKVYWKTIKNELKDYSLVGRKFKTYQEYEDSLIVECKFLNFINRFIKN